MNNLDAARPAHPSGPPAVRMRWKDLLFMHWSVPVEALRHAVPEAFDIETFQDRAWIGLVPFTMTNVQPRWLPRLPFTRQPLEFPECNVRTYVRIGEESGVYFLSLDASSRMAVWGGRAFYHLPYRLARMSKVRSDWSIEYCSDRVGNRSATLRCTWKPGEMCQFGGDADDQSRNADLARFLTERYQLLTVNSKGRPYRCRIVHEPWPLRHAELLALDESLIASAGITVPPDQRPVLHHADRLDVEAWPLERIE